MIFWVSFDILGAWRTPLVGLGNRRSQAATAKGRCSFLNHDEKDHHHHYDRHDCHDCHDCHDDRDPDKDGDETDFENIDRNHPQS